LFVRVERRRGPLARAGCRRCCRWTSFASRQFTSVNVVTFLVYGALGGVIFLLVLQLQLVAGFLAAGGGHRAAAPPRFLMLALSSRAGGARAAGRGPRWPMDRRHRNRAPSACCC